MKPSCRLTVDEGKLLHKHHSPSVFDTGPSRGQRIIGWSRVRRRETQTPGREIVTRNGEERSLGLHRGVVGSQGFFNPPERTPNCPGTDTRDTQTERDKIPEKTKEDRETTLDPHTAMFLSFETYSLRSSTVPSRVPKPQSDCSVDE